MKTKNLFSLLVIATILLCAFSFEKEFSIYGAWSATNSSNSKMIMEFNSDNTLIVKSEEGNASKMKYTFEVVPKSEKLNIFFKATDRKYVISSFYEVIGPDEFILFQRLNEEGKITEATHNDEFLILKRIKNN
jgi:hypothetical protein